MDMVFFIYLYFHKSFIQFKGVFARKYIPKGNFICTVPGYFFVGPQIIDHCRHYVWEIREHKRHIDSTCFQESVVLPHGFGQFVNTSHPQTAWPRPNAQYVCGEDFSLSIEAIRDINTGEEILCDYHWQLAVIDPSSGFGESSSAIAAGRKCATPFCQQSRRNIKKYNRVIEEISGGHATIWEMSSAHVSQIVLQEFQAPEDFRGKSAGCL
jgi:hypothetical protein